MIRESLEGLLHAAQDRGLDVADPFPALLAWFEEAAASGQYKDSNAMSLATATPDGAPSVRVVLCKAIEPSTRSLTFFTNYQSRKGAELEANPRAAVVFHWPHRDRQARVEGSVARVPEDESDRYFASRGLLSRLGAIASRQSQPLDSRRALIARAIDAAARSAGNPPRPPWWGGFRLHARAVELWTAGDARFHRRTRWDWQGDSWSRRELSP